MTYRIILLPSAESDVDSIIGYLAERSPQGAVAWSNVWHELLAELRERPLSFSLAPESSRHEMEIRHALFKTRHGRLYRALFAIVTDTVHVIHVRGPGQEFLAPDELQLG